MCFETTSSNAFCNYLNSEFHPCNVAEPISHAFQSPRYPVRRTAAAWMAKSLEPRRYPNLLLFCHVDGFTPKALCRHLTAVSIGHTSEPRSSGKTRENPHLPECPVELLLKNVANPSYTRRSCSETGDRIPVLPEAFQRALER